MMNNNIKTLIRPFYNLFKYDIGGVLISMGITKKYSRIRDMRNAYAGRKCFLIGSGPSLLIEDLQKLSESDYVTIACNSMYKAYDLCDWKADIYCICDTGVYESAGKFALEKQGDRPFMVSEEVYRIANDDRLIPVRVKHNLDHDKRRRFSARADKYIFPAASVLYFMIQIAVYLGFEEIYLLGCDCNYSYTKTESGKIEKTGTKDYFMPGYEGRKDVQPFNQYDLVIPDYEAARKYIDIHGPKIFNATRGGKLETFERVNFDEVI